MKLGTNRWRMVKNRPTTSGNPSTAPFQRRKSQRILRGCPDTQSLCYGSVRLRNIRTLLIHCSTTTSSSSAVCSVVSRFISLQKKKKNRLRWSTRFLAALQHSLLDPSRDPWRIVGFRKDPIGNLQPSPELASQIGGSINDLWRSSIKIFFFFFLFFLNKQNKNNGAIKETIEERGNGKSVNGPIWKRSYNWKPRRRRRRCNKDVKATSIFGGWY